MTVPTLTNNGTINNSGTINRFGVINGTGTINENQPVTSLIEMVWVEAGTFTLGRELNPAVGGSHQLNPHQVTLTGRQEQRSRLSFVPPLKQEN